METCSTQLWIRVVRRKSDSLNIWFCVLCSEQVCSTPYTVHAIYTFHHLRISYCIFMLYMIYFALISQCNWCCGSVHQQRIQYYSLCECISNFSDSHGEHNWQHAHLPTLLLVLQVQWSGYQCVNRNTLQYHSYNNLRSHTLTSEFGDEGNYWGFSSSQHPNCINRWWCMTKTTHTCWVAHIHIKDYIMYLEIGRYITVIQCQAHCTSTQFEPQICQSRDGADTRQLDSHTGTNTYTFTLGSQWQWPQWSHWQHQVLSLPTLLSQNGCRCLADKLCSQSWCDGAALPKSVMSHHTIRPMALHNNTHCMAIQRTTPCGDGVSML